MLPAAPTCALWPACVILVASEDGTVVGVLPVDNQLEHDTWPVFLPNITCRGNVHPDSRAARAALAAEDPWARYDDDEPVHVGPDAWDIGLHAFNREPRPPHLMLHAVQPPQEYDADHAHAAPTPRPALTIDYADAAERLTMQTARMRMGCQPPEAPSPLRDDEDDGWIAAGMTTRGVWC